MKLPFFLAKRFVAAEDLSGAIPVVDALHQNGLTTTMNLLGEYVKERDLALLARDKYLEIVEVLSGETTPSNRNISVKLSMIGQKIEEDFCVKKLRSILDAAVANKVFIRLDMEGTDTTDSTLAIFERVHADYLDNVGIVLQAYLKRTDQDINRMCEINARVRICKGAYKEPPSLAYQNMSEIREKMIEQAKKLIVEGNYPGIATHDDQIIQATRDFVAENNISNDRFEFQMIYGIRPETQLSLAREGYNMRVYVPFGRKWVPYFYRRLRERKENVWFVLKNLFRR
ncbi:MAG: proline dehydrogenase [Rhodothermales bacterium]|nr:proline dehydrogenase [Rhodothermales bacterium]